jgi:hypothetical protein
MIGSKALSCLLRTQLGDVGHVAGDAAFDHELAVHLDLGKDLLNADRKVLSVLLGVLLLDWYPGTVEVLVEGKGEQRQEKSADDQEGAA